MKGFNEGGRESKTLGGIKIQKSDSRSIKQEVKERALEALQSSDISKVFEIIGADKNTKEMSAAMKAILAEKIADYSIAAIEEAKKRNMDFSAATIIIAANKRR
ncbi:MAG: hypothetical protein ACP5LH_01555 [Candidatus Micrarchaeia archaeon]